MTACASVEFCSLAQAWSGQEQLTQISLVAKAGASKTEKDKVKQDLQVRKPEDAPVVVATADPKPIKTATKSLLDDAYPDMLSIAATALEFWTKGKTEVPSFCPLCPICVHSSTLDASCMLP